MEKLLLRAPTSRLGIKYFLSALFPFGTLTGADVVAERVLGGHVVVTALLSTYELTALAWFAEDSLSLFHFRCPFCAFCATIGAKIPERR